MPSRAGWWVILAAFTTAIALMLARAWGWIG
jgi:hypothetical protein